MLFDSKDYFLVLKKYSSTYGVLYYLLPKLYSGTNIISKVNMYI